MNKIEFEKCKNITVQKFINEYGWVAIGCFNHVSEAINYVKNVQDKKELYEIKYEVIYKVKEN